jgi:predicted nucleic acid-binding protein
MSVWVVNASPLILLGKIARLSLLAELSERVVIPHEVALEIDAGPVTDPARLWLAALGRSLVTLPESFDLRVVAWDLGKGETAVICQALS